MESLPRLLQVTSPAPVHAWNELVSSDPDAVAEQSPKWIKAMERRGYVDASRLFEFDDGHRFVLPLVQRKRLSLLPAHGYATGWGIGGIVGPGCSAAHVTSIAADLAGLASVAVHVRPNPLQARCWSDADTGAATPISRRAHVVDLADGADAVWGRMRASGRRGVKKAEKSGVEVELHLGGAGLDSYYDKLFLPSVARWAENQREPLVLAMARARRRDPLEKLVAIAETLGNDFRLYLAAVDGQITAGNIVVWHPNAHATRGAMDDTLSRKTRAGYALEWAAIEDACHAGHRWYQLGESGQNKELAAYKERFGAVAVDYCEYRFERLPLLAVDQRVRGIVKKLIGFQD